MASDSKDVQRIITGTWFSFSLRLISDISWNERESPCNISLKKSLLSSSSGKRIYVVLTKKDMANEYDSFKHNYNATKWLSKIKALINHKKIAISLTNYRPVRFIQLLPVWFRNQPPYRFIKNRDICRLTKASAVQFIRLKWKAGTSNAFDHFSKFIQFV